MKIFYLTLFVTFLLSIVARTINDQSNKPNLYVTFVIIAVLSVVAGLRNTIGDTLAYMNLYRFIGSGGIVNGSYETGFVKYLSVLNWLSPDPQLMLLVTALLTNGLIILTLRNYSCLFELQTFMYITSGYYLTTMNGIRQCLVAAVLFASTKFIIEGKFIKYLLITLLMYTFHTSALILIPVYFIVRQDAWSKKTMILLSFLPVLFLFFKPLMSFMFQNMGGLRYAAYKSDILTGGEEGANFYRAVIAAVPIIIAFLGRHKLKREWPASNVFVGMSLINFIVMVFALYNWIIARFQLYFELYNFILLPYMINTLFKEKQLIYLLFIVFYAAFFYYEQAITLAVKYMSNFF